MHTPATAYPDWKAPAEDAKLLIWPEPQLLLRDTIENLSRLTREESPIQKIPLREVRKRTREFVNHDDPIPLFASAHQTELYHPGVWVKDVLANVAARQINGAAFHFAVDTDAPKHLVLKWLGGSAPITDDPRLTTAAWCGLLEPPTPAHLQSMSAQFHEAHPWDFDPVLPQVLDSLRRLSLEAHNLSNALTNAQHELDWSLGLRHHALLASPLWLCESFGLFVHHILARADDFAADYNRALAEYRRDHRIRTNSRPMPDLDIQPEAIEMPFWLDNLSTSKRSRFSVIRTGDSWALHLPDKQQFIFDRSRDGWEASARLLRFLNSAAHRIAPRALTLTMFMRLCLVDQFIHGIGGGRYDQVTDALIGQHFGIEPPAFAVTTATMYFPEALNRPRVCVPCVLHEGHRLRHGVLGARKMHLVNQINALPRGSPQRKLAFHQMHDELDASARTHPLLREWEKRLSESRQLAREEQMFFDRALFYAIQPRDRLGDMIEKYEQAVRS